MKVSTHTWLFAVAVAVVWIDDAAWWARLAVTVALAACLTLDYAASKKGR